MPMHYLAIDMGSTSLTAVVIDLAAKAVVGTSSVANTAEITGVVDGKKGRSEWDLDRMTELAVDNAADLVGRTGVQPAAIGVTGQQQGLQLLDAQLKAVGPFISWQDQRAKDPISGDGQTYLQAVGTMGGAVAAEGGLPAFARTGCPLVAGYGVSILYWLRANDLLPSGVSGTTVPEFVVSRLTGVVPVTDSTDGMGWGVYDVADRDWDYPLVEALGLPRALLPDLVDSCTIAGGLSKSVAARLGVSAGIPVAVASGDHQCSFAATVADRDNTVAINVGTGGQASVYVGQPVPHGWLELRPYMQSGYLLAGVGVVGGRTFRVLRDFFAQAVADFTSGDRDPELIYTRLVELAGEVPAGAEGLRVDPLFTGSRSNPHATASFCGLTPQTFTPGHMARALFEGMAVQLADSYRQAVALGAGERSRLVGSGNGLKLNALLREALAAEFGMQVEVGAQKEEAAVGAALCAAVADGAYASIAGASAEFTGSRADARD